jgi:hypothetical protein
MLVAKGQQQDGAPILFSYNNASRVLSRTGGILSARPLETLAIAAPKGTTIKVADGKGHEYISIPVKNVTTFIVSGALGTHTIKILDANKKTVDTILFNVDAQTNIDDGGTYKELFELLYKAMCVYSPDGVQTIDWNGKKIHFFESWELDNYNCLKGMQYFSPYGNELTDVMRKMQQQDGMIWSFIARNNTRYYFETAYKKYGFFLRDGDCYFVRQPIENHIEYIYVNTIYKYWKGSGNDAWMRESLGSAAAALNYVARDSLRWSSKYQLLKRGLTIDSWDFQVDDEYTPKLGTGNPMLVAYGKTKFGIFYGDNTGYIQACNELAEMYRYAGKNGEAVQFAQRAKEISDRLNALCWNGKFFTHFIDEDPSVKRNLGVDMQSQFSQSNAYSLNRGLRHDQNVSIIKTYLDLRDHLPIGSPAEWYSIYPPFERGFEPHDAKWQYMNGGVGGHIAGELALGAFENGYENYGTDILKKLLELGNKYGEGKRIWFAYTGSIPEPPSQVKYKAIDLSAYANMDLWDKSKGASMSWLNSGLTDGNDLRNMPVGDTVLQGVLFHITDPEKNSRKSVIAVSSQKGLPQQVSIPVNDTAAAIYLLHTVGASGATNIFASVSIQYADGTMRTQYLQKEKELTNWWFPSLASEKTDVGWAGPNLKSAKVGVYRLAIDNHQPQKKISNIILTASMEENIYVLLGLTLSSQPHYVKPKPESFGGPDDWAAATGMAALVEGLAGVKDKSVAYGSPIVSPRWLADQVDSVNVTARYAASKGYVSYQFTHDKNKRQITILATGSGDDISFHVLLPLGANVKNILVDNNTTAFTQSKIENTSYADFSMKLGAVRRITIVY